MPSSRIRRAVFAAIYAASARPMKMVKGIGHTNNVTNAPARFSLIVSRTKTSENIAVHEVGSGSRCVKSYIEDKSDNGE